MSDVYTDKMIVFDNGSDTFKAGFSGYDAPRSLFPCVTGKPRQGAVPFLHSKKENFVGDEAQNLRFMLTLQYPLEKGTVTNWNAMENIWRYAFHDELRVSPEDFPVLLTEVFSNGKSGKEKMSEIMYEKFKVPALFLASQAVLSLYASGMTTGIVLNSGHNISHVVPVYEGYSIFDAILQLNVAGADLTDFLCKILLERGHNFSSASEKKIVRNIKEKECYVATDFEREMNSSCPETTYELPDGQEIIVGNEKFRCPEIMFQPSILGLESPGVHEIIHSSIMKTNVDFHKILFENIVLSGGTTLSPNISERLQREIETLNSNVKVKIIAPPERKHLAWIGGSILACCSSFEQMWVSRSEYDESGPVIINRKCCI